AELVTQLDARGVVQPYVTRGLLQGDPAAISTLDAVVHERVLSDRVVRVKIWTATGAIVYSDALTLIGQRFDLGDDEEHALASGEADSDVSDLTKPENRLESGFGKLLEVYVPVRAADGAKVLFETYQRDAAVRADELRVWSGLFPVLIAGLALLFMVEVP